MDVTVVIPNEISIADPNGVIFKQVILYDLLSPFCQKCQKVGHSCERKNDAITKNKNIT